MNHKKNHHDKRALSIRIREYNREYNRIEGPRTRREFYGNFYHT